MTYSLKHITFGSIDDLLPDAKTITEKIGSAIFQQKLFNKKRICLVMPTCYDDVPFALKNPLSEKDFLRRIEDYLASKNQYLSDIRCLDTAYF